MRRSSKGIPKSHRLTQLETKLLDVLQKLLTDEILLLKWRGKRRKLSSDIQELPDVQELEDYTGGPRSSGR